MRQCGTLPYCYKMRFQKGTVCWRKLSWLQAALTRRSMMFNGNGNGGIRGLGHVDPCFDHQIADVLEPSGIQFTSKCLHGYHLCFPTCRRASIRRTSAPPIFANARARASGLCHLERRICLLLCWVWNGIPSTPSTTSSLLEVHFRGILELHLHLGPQQLASLLVHIGSKLHAAAGRNFLAAVSSLQPASWVRGNWPRFRVIAAYLPQKVGTAFWGLQHHWGWWKRLVGS